MLAKMDFWTPLITTAITVTVSLLVTFFWNRLLGKPGEIKAEKKRQEEDTQCLKAGLQALLRSRLLTLHDECVKQGYASTATKEDFENLYKSYHALGANGVMDEAREVVLGLPTVKPVKSKTLLND